LIDHAIQDGDADGDFDLLAGGRAGLKLAA